MMTKKKTSASRRVKFAWALPAIALLLFAFAEPEYKTKAIETIIPASDVHKGEKEFVINGKVVREDNEKPLEGASVIIKGTMVGTVTDADGRFTLTDPNPKKGQINGFYTDVVISYVGLESRVITVSSVGETLTPELPDIRMMEGVIYIDLPDYKNVPPPPPPPPFKDEKIDNKDEVFTIVEELPQYPGGIYDLAKYVAENQEKLSKQKKIKGKVLVYFTVDEKGKAANIKIFDISKVKLKYALDKENKIKDAEIETSKDPKIQEAAVSIVKNMPDWKPGSQRGKPVPVHYILPVEF